MREPIPHRHPYLERGLEAPDKPPTLTPPYRLQFCASNPPQVEIVKFAERIRQVPQARCSPGAPAIASLAQQAADCLWNRNRALRSEPTQITGCAKHLHER